MLVVLVVVVVLMVLVAASGTGRRSGTTDENDLSNHSDGNRKHTSSLPVPFLLGAWAMHARLNCFRDFGSCCFICMHFNFP